ncbi:hypothetical protein M378DRAFT_16882 [Amanita muscaria Koide BX008]|uniref:Uncharacterized protein n=1 Tax=Amanita muscaria (strain Koide BX008) TaxID=946122 RepID=A0A0C2SRN2_AMAMK|nr:hypothetical protein M378DRAFT_16882 [Amanita muscaria Koide BX008]
MSSPTVPSYVFPDTCSPSPTLQIPTPIILPVLAPLPVSAHYIPVNNDGITYVHSQASSRAPTPEHQTPRLSTPDPPTSPRWIPVSPSTLTITPPLSTPLSTTDPPPPPPGSGLAAVPSSVTTVPPFDSLNVNAPPFIPPQPLTPHPSREPRQPLTEISMNNPQDLSLITRRARRCQRAQNATARRPNIPPPPPTQQRTPQTARRGRPRRQAARPRSDPNEGLRPDPLEGFYEAAGEWIDGYHGVSD